MRLLLYGLQRSGTNYLETLLRNSYKVKLLNSNLDRSSPLQKHFRLYDNKELIPEPRYRNNYIFSNFNEFEELFNNPVDHYLIISKDPYSWLISYKKWARKCGWNNVQYHYIEEYNNFYGKWLEFASQTEKIKFIRYIDILVKHHDVMDDFEQRLGMQKKTFSIPYLAIFNKVPQSRRFTSNKQDYYTNKCYLNEYNKTELDELNDKISPSVLDGLNYNFESL